MDIVLLICGWTFFICLSLLIIAVTGLLLLMVYKWFRYFCDDKFDFDEV